MTLSKKRSLSKKAMKRSSSKKRKSSRVKRNSSSRIIKGSGDFTINDIAYIKIKDRNKHVIDIIDDRIRKKIKDAINKEKGINNKTKEKVQSIMNTNSINITVTVTEVYTSGVYLIIVTNHPNV